MAYLKFCWKFMLFIFAVGIITFFLVYVPPMSTLPLNPIGIFALAATFLAGWKAAQSRFNIKQVLMVGIFCFLGMIWFVPFAVMPYLTNLPPEYFLPNLLITSAIVSVVNLLIYVVSAGLGGWLYSKIRK